MTTRRAFLTGLLSSLALGATLGMGRALGTVERVEFEPEPQSIWLIGWGEGGASAFYPKGSMAGLCPPYPWSNPSVEEIRSWIAHHSDQLFMESVGEQLSQRLAEGTAPYDETAGVPD